MIYNNDHYCNDNDNDDYSMNNVIKNVSNSPPPTKKITQKQEAISYSLLMGQCYKKVIIG